MKASPTPLEGLVVIEPRVLRDDRGFFLESYRDEHFAALGLPTTFRQDNHSRSRRGVLRGLHFQQNRPQGKLVTVIRGEVFDVAVDVRLGSPTFGRWFGLRLSDDEPRAVWIPPGFAHGFCVLSEIADVVYKCTEVYEPDDDRGVCWSDPGLAIDWPVSRPVLSSKDMSYAGLYTTRTDLPQYTGE